MDRALLSALIAGGVFVLASRGQRTADAMRRNLPLLLFLLTAPSARHGRIIRSSPSSGTRKLSGMS